MTDGRVSRRPFWLTVDDAPTAAWLHHPADHQVRPNGVVLCPAFGFEYSHSHRSLVHLGDRLAAEGFAVLRIDYPGTGDSAGDEESEGLVERWLRSIEEALAFVERATGAAPSVVGLRLGALLASCAAKRHHVHGYVAWAPVVLGRRFVREARALHHVSKLGNGGADGFLQAGGFRISESTAASLSQLDIGGAKQLIQGEALVIDRSDLPLGPRLPGAEELGVVTTTIEQSDFLDMMAEPHYTRVPDSTLAEIVEWVSRTSSSELKALDPAVMQEIESARSCRLLPEQEGSITEELVIIPLEDGAQVFGVLCRPAEDLASGQLLLLPNSGSVHHVGPHRLHVELARELAAIGRASFRLDGRSLGDGRIGVVEGENHPYPATAVADVAEAIEWLKEGVGYTSFVVGGLCSGAHTSFHVGAGLPDPAISGVVSINPLTFHFAQGMSLDTPRSQQTSRDAAYYREAIKSPAHWLRLLRGKANMGALLEFLRRRFLQVAWSRVRLLLRLFKLRKATRLALDLERIDEWGRSILFVFSSGDPGLDILADQARITERRLTRKGTVRTSMVPGADHTFSMKEHRQLAIDAVTDHLTKPSS